MSRRTVFCLIIVLLYLVLGCSKKPVEVTELNAYPLDSMDGLITQSGIEIDREVSSDGNGSLRITSEEVGTTVVRLFETGDIDVEDARLTYQAKVRTQGVKGKVYLEMWCHFAGRGEAFSRDLQTPLTGTVNWATEETPFFLRKGENPDNIKLNLVIEGEGTAWIDDIHLFKSSLR